MSLTEKNKPVVLVTGSAKRIGKAIIQYLHQQNYDVIVHYHQSYQDSLSIINELNNIRKNSAIALQADLSKLNDITLLTSESIQWKGKVNVLVNNASLFKPNDIKQSTEIEWENLFNSTAKGCYFLSQQLISTLNQHNGNIINLIDTHYLKPRNGFSLYSMAKSVLAMQTKSFALELAPKIRVNGIAPGHFIWPDCRTYNANEQKKTY